MPRQRFGDHSLRFWSQKRKCFCVGCDFRMRPQGLWSQVELPVPDSGISWHPGCSTQCFRRCSENHYPPRLQVQTPCQVRKDSWSLTIALGGQRQVLCELLRNSEILQRGGRRTSYGFVWGQRELDRTGLVPSRCRCEAVGVGGTARENTRQEAGQRCCPCGIRSPLPPWWGHKQRTQGRWADHETLKSKISGSRKQFNGRTHAWHLSYPEGKEGERENEQGRWEGERRKNSNSSSNKQQW